jgi:hypothetical protein
MKPIGRLVWLAVGLLAIGLGPDDASATQATGGVVDLDGLKSRVPAEWKEEKPTNRMRFAQFRLPKVAGDPDDAEMVIFQGIGGSAQANIDRWKGMFVPPEGKKIGDIAKVTDTKVGSTAAPYLQVCGTYKFKAAPFDPNAKEELKPHYCMLAVVYEGKQTAYHIRIVGPEKSVEHYKKGFEGWLNAFK